VIGGFGDREINTHCGSEGRAMRAVIRKYGGSSLATVARVRRVAGQIAEVHRGGHGVVVVVSARGDATDDMLRLAAEFGDLRPSRDLDQLLATGECASAALLALALRALGVPAASLTGPQAGVLATGTPGAGRITAVRPDRVLRLLAGNTVAVVAGFQGLDMHSADDAGDVVTLGRGGSDTTAVALAAALRASRCDIYTDVDGVYTADPRVVADARLRPELDVTTMAELAVAGAKVVHQHAVGLAAVHGVELQVGNSWTGRRGSVIRPVPAAEALDTEMLDAGSHVLAVAHDLDVARVMARARGTGPDPRRAVLDVLARCRVPVDFVAHSGPDERTFRMGFTVRRDDAAVVLPPLRRALAGTRGTVAVDRNVGKVSVVGSGLLDRTEWTARMTAVLSAAGITALWTCVSQQRASVVTPLDRALDAVRLLHQEFGLSRSAVDGSAIEAEAS
jgi:aspartate kinase